MEYFEIEKQKLEQNLNNVLKMTEHSSSPDLRKTAVMRRFFIWWHKRKYKDSLMDGRMYGKFYVRYPDGQRSMLMYYKTANDYSKMFGGEVKCIINGA